MNTLTVILVFFAIIVMCGAVIYALIKDRKAQKKEIQELNTSLQSARINIEQLSKYIDDVLKIKSEEKSISQKIKEAENDEEVHNIINDIIALNNNRVQND